MELLTIKDIADMMKFSVSHVRQNIITQRGFPKPILLPGAGRRLTQRWDKEEISEYLVQLRGN